MNNETLRLSRNILLRTFVVGVILAVLLALATTAFWTPCVGTIERLFHVSEATLAPMVLNFFLNVRFLLVFLILAPALALHWTLKKDK